MFDPISLWMQSSLIWIRIFKQQQDMYMSMLGKVAEKLPHETAEDLAREAEAMKKIASPAPKKVVRKPARSASAQAAAPVTA